MSTVSDPSSDGIITRIVRVQAFQILLVLIAIWLVFAAMEPDTFASVGNMRLIAQNASILAILGVGMTFVIITAGIDLSIGSVMVFSGVVGAKVMIWQGGDGWGTASLGIVAAIVSGLAWTYRR
jgi:ribose transport system permease protein